VKEGATKDEDEEEEDEEEEDENVDTKDAERVCNPFVDVEEGGGSVVIVPTGVLTLIEENPSKRGVLEEGFTTVGTTEGATVGGGGKETPCVGPPPPPAFLDVWVTDKDGEEDEEEDGEDEKEETRARSGSGLEGG